MVLTIFFFQDKKHIDNRGNHSIAYATVEMPIPSLRDLLSIIKKTPDNLELFFRHTFPGLDSTGEEIVGLRRVSAKGFYLIRNKDKDIIVPRSSELASQPLHQQIHK